MGEPKTAEPSMEEILASIKRIISDDGAPSAARARPRPVAVPDAEDEEGTVLELTETVAEPAVEPARKPRARTAAPPAPDTELVSEQAAVASRDALLALSKVVVKPEPGTDNTLDGLVREMLRPMLKEWLDQRLPELVEGLVAREIARITGRSL
jgi:cell pole-organizing protein PopZ